MALTNQALIDNVVHQYPTHFSRTTPLFVLITPTILLKAITVPQNYIHQTFLHRPGTFVYNGWAYRSCHSGAKLLPSHLTYYDFRAFRALLARQPHSELKCLVRRLQQMSLLVRPGFFWPSGVS